MVKKPCCARTLPAPLQVPQADGRVPARAPEPPQGSQCTVPGTRIVRLLAAVGVLQRDFHVVAEVRATCRLPPAAAALAAAHELAEEIVEDIGEAGAEVEPARAGAAGRTVERGVAEAVVGRALLLVGEHVVGLGNLP